MNDESLCAQFASFMKTLSLKLNIHTVQFFFIEETGAFPILTRAVELLTIPDPMIRIASQSTILNVYRVEDSRARAYALQDEVMGIMFAQTVNFMENQYHTIFKTCKMYYKACNANDEAESTKMESKIDDILSSMEDWFYYLQDLLDLDVPILRKALVHQLIHDFLLPVLLGPLLKHHSVYVDEGTHSAITFFAYCYNDIFITLVVLRDVDYNSQPIVSSYFCLTFYFKFAFISHPHREIKAAHWAGQPQCGLFVQKRRTRLRQRSIESSAGRRAV